MDLGGVSLYFEMRILFMVIPNALFKGLLTMIVMRMMPILVVARQNLNWEMDIRKG